MGRSVKDTRRRIDTGCLNNGYEYHCWSCELDLCNLYDNPVANGEPGIARIDDIFITE